MKIIATIFLFTTIVLNLSAQSAALKIMGSETCLPLLQQEADEYMKTNSTTSITVFGGGSSVGIFRLISGNIDIAMSSRSIKMDEKLKLQDAGKTYKEIIFAQDALSVIVNPANKINQLTREQIEAIFTGKIKNWKEVGGDDLAIVICSRVSSSGAYEFFKEHVLGGKSFASTALLKQIDATMVQSVSQTNGAIGYISLAYVDKTIKAIGVSYDKGKTFVTPSLETAKNKTYPVTRRLYLYYIANNENKVGEFYKYILSPAGQEIVKKNGFVPLK